MNGIEEIRKHSLIVCAMTSWTKRITNCYDVVVKLLNQTVKPDRVYLTLSSDEFPGKENDLPRDLVELSRTNERFIINWVKENTKSMKKVFPILQYLKDDDFILNCDDDMNFPKDFIECRLKEFIDNGSIHPISGGNNPKCHITTINGLNYNIITGASIFQKKIFKDYEQIVNSELIETYNDDYLYTLLSLMNGYKIVPTKILSTHSGRGPIKIKSINDSDGLGKKHQYSKNRVVLSIFEKRYLNKFGSTFKDKLKGIHYKRYDCVMPYTSCGADSRALTCGNHLEIEYVIASLKKYCSSWLGRIFIVGSEPPEVIKDDVIHISCDDPYTHCKDANIIHKIRYACEHIPNLSDDFLMISDDQIVTKESRWEDMIPRVVRKYSDWSESKWNEKCKRDIWDSRLYQTLKLFSKETSAFWEPHIWSPMNKYKFIEMCKTYDYEHSVACIILTLYYNFIKQPIIYDFDHISPNQTYKKIGLLNKNNVPRHLSWKDNSFQRTEFRNLLDDIVGFNKKPVLKKDYSYNESTISRLKKDIAEGRIVRLSTGKAFIWKKIK